MRIHVQTQYGLLVPMAVLFLLTACSSNQAEAPAPSSDPPTTAVTDYNSTAENVFSLYEGEDMSTED